MFWKRRREVRGRLTLLPACASWPEQTERYLRTRAEGRKRPITTKLKLPFFLSKYKPNKSSLLCLSPGQRAQCVERRISHRPSPLWAPAIIIVIFKYSIDVDVLCTHGHDCVCVCVWSVKCVFFVSRAKARSSVWRERAELSWENSDWRREKNWII